MALKSTSEVWIAAAYSSGGSSPNSTTSGSRWISGTPGKYDPATPTAISSSGAGKSMRSARAVNASTTTAMATSRNAISTAPLCPSPPGPDSSAVRCEISRWASQTIGGGSGGLGDPAHRVAPAELLEAVLAEREHDERPPVGGEGEHVRDHPAVREHLGRLAQRVDERVVDAAVVDDVADVGEVRRALDARAARASSSATRAPRPTSRSRGSPSRRSTCPSGRSSRDSSDRIVCRSSSTSSSIAWSSCSSVSRSASRTISPVSQTWCSTIFVSRSIGVTLSRRGQPEARRVGGSARRSARAIWMWPGLRAPGRRRDAVRLGERAGERLVRAVARLHGDVDQRRRRRDHPVRRPLEQDAPAERAAAARPRPTGSSGRSGSARSAAARPSSSPVARRGRRAPRRGGRRSRRRCRRPRSCPHGASGWPSRLDPTCGHQQRTYSSRWSTTCTASSPRPMNVPDLNVCIQCRPKKYSPGTSVTPRVCTGAPATSRQGAWSQP